MADCMLDFRLADDGQFELANVGDATLDCVMERCYPELNKAIAAAEWDEEGLDYSALGQRQIREAVELERTRLGASQPKDPETEIGREIQKQTDAPSAVVNRIVREAAKKRLQSREGEGKKPN